MHPFGLENQSSVKNRSVVVSNDDLRGMKEIDEIHLQQTFRESRRIHDELIDRGDVAGINRKRAKRLMRQIDEVQL